ncbi:MAG: SgcJ/EcaC family oxidoreductase [Janthinobacterium lividum]
MPAAHAGSDASLPLDAQQARIAALFTKWNAALGTGDPREVNARYTADAILLPTKSSEARITAQAREAYFRDFLKKYPGVTATIDTHPARVIRVSGRKATDTGHYTFTTADGKRIKARYSFIYREDDNGQWLIASHHSSALPA